MAITARATERRYRAGVAIELKISANELVKIDDTNKKIRNKDRDAAVAAAPFKNTVSLSESCIR